MLQSFILTHTIKAREIKANLLPEFRGSLQLYTNPSNIPTLFQLVILFHVKGVVQLKTDK